MHNHNTFIPKINPQVSRTNYVQQLRLPNLYKPSVENTDDQPIRNLTPTILVVERTKTIKRVDIKRIPGTSECLRDGPGAHSSRKENKSASIFFAKLREFKGNKPLATAGNSIYKLRAQAGVEDIRSIARYIPSTGKTVECAGRRSKISRYLPPVGN